jgi:hypothetical protein
MSTQIDLKTAYAATPSERSPHRSCRYCLVIAFVETLDGSGNVTAAQLYAPYGGLRYSSGAMPTAKGSCQPADRCGHRAGRLRS